MMEYPLTNKLKSGDNWIHIERPPNKYYLDESGAHTVTLTYGTIIFILYDGVLTYIHVWSPTPKEIYYCLYVAFTPRNSWEPFLSGTFSML